MATYYVRSGATGTGTGANWTNAYTTLTLALASKLAGDVFYVSEDHSESTATTVTLTSPGTNANPCFFYCVNHSGSVPPVSADLRTTGQIATTGNINITLAGAWVCDGLIFHCGITGSAGGPNLNVGNTAGLNQAFRNCAFRNGSTAGAAINLASSLNGSFITLDNCTFQWAGTAASGIVLSGRIVWRGGSVTGSAFPTTLFTSNSSRGAILLVQGVDLSGLGSGKTIVGAMSALGTNLLTFMDCKLNASVTLAATPGNPGSNRADFIRCNSGAVNYDMQRYEYAGTQTIETTIVRTGGASDGTTPISWDIVTTANARWALPFEAPPIAIWNDTVGSSVTVTVYGIWGGGAVPNNDDIWIDVEYLGSSATPQSSLATSTKADNLASGSALTSDSSTWGGSTTAFKMTATFTPQQKGYLYIYPRAGKASSTFYVDPLAVLS